MRSSSPGARWFGVALEAARAMEQRWLNVAVLDLRWLSPLDEDALRQAVLDAGGRVVVAHEANLTGGFGAEIVTRIHEMLDDQLTLKIKRVATPNVRMPAAPVLAQGSIAERLKDCRSDPRSDGEVETSRYIAWRYIAGIKYRRRM